LAAPTMDPPPSLRGGTGGPTGRVPGPSGDAWTASRGVATLIARTMNHARWLRRGTGVAQARVPVPSGDAWTASRGVATLIARTVNHARWLGRGPGVGQWLVAVDCEEVMGDFSREVEVGVYGGGPRC